jgi:high-affinity Fe2+/Pb2+ permease
MTYAQIVSATIGPAVLAGVYWLRGNRASYWNDLWLIAAILLLLLGSIQAFRKWRLESAQAKVS